MLRRYSELRLLSSQRKQHQLFNGSIVFRAVVGSEACAGAFFYATTHCPLVALQFCQAKPSALLQDALTTCEATVLVLFFQVASEPTWPDETTIQHGALAWP